MSGDLQPNSTGLYTHYKDFLLKGGMTIPTCGSLYIIYASGGGSGALVGPRRCEAQHRTGSGLGLSDKIIYISFSLICIARKNFSFCFQIRRISLFVSLVWGYSTLKSQLIDVFFPPTGHHSKDENVLFGKIGIYGGLLCVGREMEYRGVFLHIGDEHAYGYWCCLISQPIILK